MTSRTTFARLALSLGLGLAATQAFCAPNDTQIDSIPVAVHSCVSPELAETQDIASWSSTHERD